MATTVFTGWRTVTPGKCNACGFDDGFTCDGRGNVYCFCQCCAECGEYDGHWGTCPEMSEDNEAEDRSDEREYDVCFEAGE